MRVSVVSCAAWNDSTVYVGGSSHDGHGMPHCGSFCRFAVWKVIRNVIPSHCAVGVGRKFAGSVGWCGLCAVMVCTLYGRCSGGYREVEASGVAWTGKMYACGECMQL